VLDYAPTALTLVDQITSGMNPYGNALGIATTRQTTP
jgi:phosphoribosylformylglycinamidine (FGAM) synthase-like enzyme